MLSLISLLVLALSFFLSYLIAQTIYNVFFHPLRHYPGPISNKASPVTWTYYAWRGQIVKHISELHETYGEVVRVTPNELSFITASAWPDIAGHRTTSGHGNLPKAQEHRRPDPNNTKSIISANDEDHRRMRRLLSHAFSDKALKEQESLLTSYVDKLISRLHQRAGSAETATLDLVRWYNYTTFDILGDLAFGSSFHCLESDDLHPWVANIFPSVRDLVFYQLARRFPSPIFQLLRMLQPKGLTECRAEEYAFALKKTRERMSQGGTDRVDFISYILKHNDEKGMSPKEIESNASLLIIAGSETTLCKLPETDISFGHVYYRHVFINQFKRDELGVEATLPMSATFLSGITYNLLQTPHVLKKLTELVRTTFSSENDINSLSVARLDYFTACIEEGLRTYPPVPIGFPRMTIGEGTTISSNYVPPGTKVYVSQSAAYHSSRNFADPNSFVPDRWVKDPPSKYANDNRGVVQPFSVGPRNCIGRNLAYAEIRLILARILWNFDMELPSSDLKWDDQKACWIHSPPRPYSDAIGLAYLGKNPAPRQAYPKKGMIGGSRELSLAKV